jgi:hypothetical protein
MRATNQGGILMLATALLAMPASAATILLHNAGGVTAGTNVYNSFSAAASFCASMLTDNVTITLDVGYAALGTGILGSTSSTLTSQSAVAVLAKLRADGSSTLDTTAIANLPTLTSAGGLSVITNGYANTTTKAGVNLATKVYDTDNSANNTSLALTTANAKALGFTGFTGADARITFSSNFAFDFAPADGIASGKYDFVGIATHEIGHALGFISGVDTYDYYGGKGPGAGTTLNLNNYSIGSTLDLFRFSKDPTNLVPGTTPVLDWSVAGTPYFSVNKGVTQLAFDTGTGMFSTGAYNGNSRQASHWIDNKYTTLGSCQTPSLARGIMDPTAGKCEALSVTALDLAAFDAIGWNIATGARDSGTVKFTTTQIANYTGAVFNIGSVPEPASWAMLIAGFGMTGATMRRRRAVASIA